MNKPYNYNFFSTILCLIIYMTITSDSTKPLSKPFQRSLSFGILVFCW